MTRSNHQSTNLVLAFSLALLAPGHTSAKEEVNNLNFQSICSAEYAKKRPNESSVEAARWCSCMDKTLGPDGRIDYLNAHWLPTLDPTKHVDQLRAARILNIAPWDIQKDSTPAAESGIKSLLSRLQGLSEAAVIICRSELEYKEK